MSTNPPPAGLDTPGATPPAGWSPRTAIIAGLAVYLVTSAVAVAGVVYGHSELESRRERRPDALDLGSAFTNWDGNWYARIAAGGYAYNPNGQSRAGFFPLYPLAGAALSWLTGLRTSWALVVVSHLSFAAACCVAARYFSARAPHDQPAVATYALISLGVFPSGFFFRVGYSEALFLLLIALTLYGIQRRWPLLLVAGIVGAATAVRLPGLALVPPLLLAAWDQLGPGRRWRIVFLLPVACWGLIAFAGYSYVSFGNPIAYAVTQNHWRLRVPESLDEKLLSLASLEPFWSAFDPTSRGYWDDKRSGDGWVFNYRLANRFLFTLAAVAVLVGWQKQWLNRYEVAAALGLLAIPYAGRAFELYMAAFARFAIPIFPMYLVLGHWLARLPRPVAWGIIGCSPVIMAVYAARFAAWYTVN